MYRSQSATQQIYRFQKSPPKVIFFGYRRDGDDIGTILSETKNNTGFKSTRPTEATLITVQDEEFPNVASLYSEEHVQG